MAIGTDVQALWGVVLGLGMAGTGIASILYYVLVEHSGAMVASSATCVPPLVANEALHVADLAAVGVTLGGIYLVRTGQARLAR